MMAKLFQNERGEAERAVLYGRERESDKETQIIRLLEQVRNRLGDMERERSEIWDAVQDQGKALSELEDKSNSTEKTFISLENRLSRSELKEAPLIERLDDLERQQKGMSRDDEDIAGLRQEILTRLEESDAQTSRLIERIDEAMAMQTRMTRRIDKVIQDKQRLSRKLSLLEEGMESTRNALSAKALVLLSDKDIAEGRRRPHIPVFSETGINEDIDLLDLKEGTNENEPYELGQKIDSVLSHDGAPQETSFRTQAIAASFFILIAGLGGWIASQYITSETPSYPAFEESSFITATERNQTNIPRFEQPQTSQTFAQIEDDNRNTNVLSARTLNQITPSSGPESNFANNSTAGPSETNLDLPSPTPAVQNITILSVDPNLPETLKNLETEAFKGNAEAQHDLAAIYTAGHGGVSQDYKRAAYWFEKASEKGIPNARYNLGVLYHQGLGVEQNLNEALKWYKKAAELGHPEAQYNLGIAHIEGIGVEYSPRQAAEYFEAAAASGITEAAFNLGLIYENGLLGSAQPDEALLWYKTAADQGNNDARNAMEQLARTLNLNHEEVDRLVEELKTPTTSAPASDQKEQSRLSEIERSKPLPLQESNVLLNTQIQEQLLALGLYPGPADGSFDPLTSDAIKLYEARHNIPVTGEASEELLVHMLTKNIRGSAAFELGSGE